MTNYQYLYRWLSKDGGRDGYPVRAWTVYDVVVWEYLDGRMAIIDSARVRWLSRAMRDEVYREGAIDAEAVR